MADVSILKRHLGRQLDFIDRSCASFDSGFKDEAIRIAVQIRVILHTTKASTSVLALLGAEKARLLSTVPPISPRTMMFQGMGFHRLGPNGGALLPLLGGGPFQDFVPSTQWWEQVVIVLDPQTRITRKAIVLAAANKDGGAHVDPKLTPAYQALSEEGAYGGYVAARNQEVVWVPATEAHFVALRDMGYELLHSPELVALANP